MADRLSQYPMMPNFNPALMQQQQQQQQLSQQQVQQAQQQQQQDGHPPVPNFTDQGRMWQQIQQMQQFRSNGGEMSPQTNAQMMDLLRSQSLAARVQAQQQQQLSNQQFELGAQRMVNGAVGGGAGGGQQPQQSQAFLDSSPNQPQQSHMPSSFAGGGLPNAPTLQQSMSRAAMLQAFQANQAGHNPNPNVARQLELMLAQNQQPQNLAARLEHQRQQQQQAQAQQQIQAMNHSSPGDIFSSPGMADRRPSPAHPGAQATNPIAGNQPMQQQHSQQQSQPQPQRRMTLNEINERAAVFRASISAQEAVLQQLSAQRGNPTDPAYVNKIRNLQGEIKMKKEYVNRMNAAIQSMTAHNMAQAAQHQQGGGGAGAGQSWISQGNPSQTFDNAGNAQLPRGPVPNQQQGQNNIQPSPSHLHAQIQQANHLISHVPPPRSGPTPQQQPHPTPAPGGSPYPNQMSPSMGQQFALPMNNVGGSSSTPASIGAGGVHPTPSSSLPLPPLDKSRFESTYKNFCASKGVKHEMRLLSVEGRNIDLHALHTQVMQEGGWGKVQSKELWNVIGGRMGFVHFVATDTEPAKSGPGVAQRLAQVYKEYVWPFDQVYINSVMNSRIKRQAEAAVQAQGAANAAASGNAGPSQPQQTGRGMLSPQQMQLVIGYANQSVADLRAQGVQENIIKFVEQNRAHLQRTVLEQGMFRGQFQNQGMRPQEQQQQQQQQQHGMASGPGGPFPGGSAQAGGAPGTVQRLAFMQQQNGGLPMQGNGFINNRPPQQPNGPGLRLDQEQIKTFIEKTVNDFRNHKLVNMRPVDIPVEQRQQFNNLFQQLHQVVTEIHSKLPMYFFVAKSEDMIKQLIAIITTVQQQHSLLANGGPYIVNLDFLRNMMGQVQLANQQANNYLSKAYNRPQQMSQSQQQQPHHHQSPGSMPPSHPPSDMSPPMPNLPQQQQQQQVPHPPNRPAVNLRPPPIMKKPSVSTPNASATAAMSTPTPPPAYSASTPVASAATPTQIASSPQAPKSPKGKAPAKAKAAPKTRRPSVKNQNQNPPAPPPPASEQPQTPASSSGGNAKRQREEETSAANAFGASPVASGSGAANEPSPPKRVKTDWEGPTSEALKKKTDAVENIKTEEDASAFLEQMTELIKMAAGGEGQESLTTDISETLDMILKGYGTVPDGSETTHNLSSLGLGESSRASPPPTEPPADEFVEFFDFSSFDPLDDDNDDGSKAPTPELIPSSSTNPSPESNSEADPHHALLSSTETKTEDFPDLLRLGTLKEIDGGESAYYQPGEWKWDSPMPTLEQPWAIFTS